MNMKTIYFIVINSDNGSEILADNRPHAESLYNKLKSAILLKWNSEKKSEVIIKNKSL